MASCREVLKLNGSGGTPLLAICSARSPEDNHDFTNMQIVSLQGEDYLQHFSIIN